MAASSNHPALPSAVPNTLGFVKRGEPFVWLTGMSLALVLTLTIGMLCVIVVNGIGVFWPSHVVLVELEDGTRHMGEVWDREGGGENDEGRLQLKVGNRDILNLDFRWFDSATIASLTTPEDAVVLERIEHGNFYGFLHESEAWSDFRAEWGAMQDEVEQLEELDEQIADLGYRVGYEAELAIDEVETPLARELSLLEAEQAALTAELLQQTATFVDAQGEEYAIPLLHIVRPYRPNAMSFAQKTVHYAAKVGELITEEPREANTEGGLYPAIFGTIILVFLMSILSFPLGVIAGVYLREYAKQGLAVRVVRIAVNNLAGVPSIVYGIFGLGFFVYGLGGAIDVLFFSERLPTPTYGTGGILWASLTLGLLTVPVVIVATEEALGAIPAGVREGSLSLGATKFQTLLRILVPMASPGILTGFILAMARAAGEVAPLMITGVVKLAPTLPIDDNFPYIHPERKFMHLGFHIYDIGFQSPNVEAAKPMVFVTTLLLILIVLAMSGTAIWLRDRMRKRYAVGDF